MFFSLANLLNQPSNPLSIFLIFSSLLAKITQPFSLKGGTLTKFWPPHQKILNLLKYLASPNHQFSNGYKFPLCSYKIFTNFHVFTKTLIISIYFFITCKKKLSNQMLKALIFILYLRCVYNKRSVQNKTKL